MTKGVEDGMGDDERTVKAVYPDAEPHSNDYYMHWIGQKRLSDSFEEEGLDELYKRKGLSPEESRLAAVIIQQTAIDKAWADARSRLPAAVPEAKPEPPANSFVEAWSK